MTRPISDKETGCDPFLSEMLAYYESIPALSIAMSQGRGDFLGDNGGHASWVKRKAMNSFICSVDRPFSFMGRINEGCEYVH